MSNIAVDSSAALGVALSTAQGGDAILLQPGTYSGLDLSNLTFSSAVTIASADPLHEAVLTNFDMDTVNGLKFSRVEFFAQQPSYVGFNVYTSQNITYDRVSVHGTLDGNPANDPVGIRIFDSSGVTVTNSEFQQLEAGLGIARSSNIVVSGNAIHDVGNDGLDFAQVSNLRVSGNAFHDFHAGPGDHPDAIQFMTSLTTASSQDIVISDNLIYRGGGDYTQGIFMGDEVGTLPFLHVTIANNVVVGTGFSGIRPTHDTDLTLTANTLISFAGDNHTNLLVQDSDQVVATGNVANSLSLKAADGNTNITETNDIGNAAAVTDQGASAIQQWLATHMPPTPMTVSFSSMQAASYGGEGNDTIDGTAPNNYLRGGSGDDVIAGGAGFDDINGNAGNDTANGAGGDDWVVGGQGDDVLFGNEGNDIVLGNLGNDTLSGGDGDDQLRGGKGDDLLNGGAGDDFLSGDRGDDTITGGAGADIFHGSSDAGVDLVIDFNQGEGDRVLLDPGTSYTARQVGADTIVDMGGGNRLILAGVQLSSLHDGWIGLG